MLPDTLNFPGSTADPGVISLKRQIVQRLFEDGVAKIEDSIDKRVVISDAATSREYKTYGEENSTIPQEHPREINEISQTLFIAAKEEFFEDGMESNFSRGLLDLVERYSKAAIEALADLILGENVNPEVASEALRWLGQIENPLSHRERRWLLEKSLLSSRSAKIRDGALLGLSFLGDPEAIPYVARAIQQEPVRELRQDMIQTLEELKAALLEGN
jgi:hypothetical protein